MNNLLIRGLPVLVLLACLTGGVTGCTGADSDANNNPSATGLSLVPSDFGNPNKVEVALPKPR